MHRIRSVALGEKCLKTLVSDASLCNPLIVASHYSYISYIYAEAPFETRFLSQSINLGKIFFYNLCTICHLLHVLPVKLRQ